MQQKAQYVVDSIAVSDPHLTVSIVAGDGYVEVRTNPVDTAVTPLGLRLHPDGREEIVGYHDDGREIPLTSVSGVESFIALVAA